MLHDWNSHIMIDLLRLKVSTKIYDVQRNSAIEHGSGVEMCWFCVNEVNGSNKGGHYLV